VRQCTAEDAARGSFDEAAAALATNSGTNVAKRQVGELVRKAELD